MRSVFERVAGPDPWSIAGLRRVWGLGIAGVMILAVSPYPVLGLISDDEIPHRIHNTVGALQYLPLWAIPVLVFTVGRDRLAAWRLALASSLAIAATGVWSGDLVPSLSWMPLATLVVLWPGVHSWRPRRMTIDMLTPAVTAGVALWVAVTESPHLVELQRLNMGDSHSVRFHFSGMAAAYIALALSTAVVLLYPVGPALRAVVAGSVATAGLCSLAWSNYESALSHDKALWLALAGGILAVEVAARAVLARKVL